MHATNSVATNNINIILDPLNAFNMTKRFLQQLLQVEGWQTARENNRVAVGFDMNTVLMAAERSVGI